MYKGGMLPAPIIQPLKANQVGSKFKVCPNTYIQIRSEVPGCLVYFTTDGTKPDPFQKGRTGKDSTNKYIGPFRLQLGKRVVRAIVTSRDRLRESPVSTKYIDVVIEQGFLSENSSYSDVEEETTHTEFIEAFPVPMPLVRRSSLTEVCHNTRPPYFTEFEGAIEGPINPVNYSGTQINVWGVPPGNIGNFLNRNQQQQVPQMVPHVVPQVVPQLPVAPVDNLPENLRKFFKQVQRLYERDSDFQAGLDNLIENGQVKEADITEKYDSFNVLIKCQKFRVDEPPVKQIVKQPTLTKPRQPISRRPTPPKPRSPSPEPIRRSPSPPPVVKPVPVIKQKPEIANVPKETIIPAKPLKNDPKLPSTYLEELEQNGTVVPAPNFDPEADAEKLCNAMKGMGTDEAVIIQIMGNRSNEQRLKIKDCYKAMFGKDLVEELKSETSGNFKKLLVALLMNPVEYDCVEIRKAIQGFGTDNSALIEILTSRSNKRLKDISQLYTKLYKKKMEDDVQSDTSGHFRKILTSLMTAGRSESNEVDLVLVRKDVDELIKAGVKKWGTDESKFNAIFGTRSYAHLRQVFIEYESKNGKPIEDSIKNEMSGNLAKAYVALINNIRSRPVYFAKEVKKALKGLGTDEHSLNRIIVSRCEVDTVQIKAEYPLLFKSTMEKDIASDVSGDYAKLLVMLLKDPAERTYENMEPEEEHVIEEVDEPVVEETPTLSAVSNFNAASDSEKLRKAMKGMGTDEKAIIAVLANRSNSQRQEVLSAYKSLLGRDLLKDLHGETSGSFRATLESLMLTPIEYDAVSYRNAIKGLGTDESTLIELLTTRTAEEINQAKEIYEKKYNSNLEKDIKSDTSGDFGRVLVSLLTATRPTGNRVDMTQAKKDAQKLVDAGVGKRGTDEIKFVTILCTRSYAQLRQIFKDYESLAGHSIEEGLKKELSGDLLKSFQAIVGCVRDRQAFFASLIHKAMKGLGTKESLLIRVIVSRCEIDMVQIKDKFQELYNSSMTDFIKGDTSGDFKRILMALLGDHEEGTGADAGAAEQPEIPLEEHVIEEREEPSVEETPTLKAASSFSATADSDKLRKAMKGLGTDEKAIIEVLGNRSNPQRQEIKNTYKTSLGRDLLKDLNSEISGSFRDIIESLMLTPVEFDAASFRKAVKGLGTDEAILIELLTTKSSEEIKNARETYRTMFNRDLEKDIISDTSGDFKSVLVSLLQANRPTGNKVDVTQAKLDAKKLVEAGVGKKGTDESQFVMILCSKSYAQLRATFEEYESLAGHSIEEGLKKEFSGDLLNSFNSIVQCVRDKQSYFASLLYKSMHGAGTKESLLIRVVVSRCEVDMVQIKQKFEKMYNSTLASFIKGDTSSDFRRILMALIGESSS